ncbi:hypothetical protein DFJ73DRAFT_830712 [Zopfochytrium polystomum]|nr:hypothetical protein DFJ73DRAFT_830712 [Zopfochytrium polystomum]
MALPATSLSAWRPRLLPRFVFIQSRSLQFLVIAQDYTDDEALSRRNLARPAHLARAKDAKKDGRVLVGGATLSHDGKMTGSMIVVDFPDEGSAREFVNQDPYTIGKVWERIDIKPFKMATLDPK